MSTAMKVLEIDSLWVESGLISPCRIDELYRQYLDTEDKSPEHYRHILFADLRKNNSVFDDMTLMTYVRLCEIDSNQDMAYCALMVLIWSNNNITLQQLIHLQLKGRIAQEKAYSILYRRVLAEPLNDDLFIECLENGNDMSQRALLDKSDLTAKWLVALSTKGKTKAVRNMAKVRLKKHQKC